MQQYTYATILSIGGSDSGGGAGIQADIKTISALGCFATTAITAITAQNTVEVIALHILTPEIVRAQLEAVLSDIRPQVIKIGMIPTGGHASVIADVLKSHPLIPVIFDPVMITSTGQQLMADECLSIIRECLLPQITLLTPNIDEAALLTGMPIQSLGDMKDAALRIVKLNCKAVLVKGGHLGSNILFDVYLDQDGNQEVFESVKIDSFNTHGTGCSLSSAIAAYIARGNNMPASIRLGLSYIYEAIAAGENVKTGHGHGPLNHFFDPQKMQKISK